MRGLGWDNCYWIYVCENVQLLFWIILSKSNVLKSLFLKTASFTQTNKELKKRDLFFLHYMGEWERERACAHTIGVYLKEIWAMR